MVLVERSEFFGEVFVRVIDIDRAGDVTPEKFGTLSEIEHDDWFLAAQFIGFVDGQQVGGDGWRFFRRSFVGTKGGRNQQTGQIKDGSAESWHSSAFANDFTNAEREADNSRAGQEHRVVAYWNAGRS